MFVKTILGLFAALAVAGALCAPASAQQFREPFQFRVHNNPSAMSMAVYLRSIQNGSGSTSSSSTGSTSSSGGYGSTTIYSSSTVGNLNEITTILEQGAEGFVGIDTSQDGSDSSQSASSEGTQVFGGAANVGVENGTATNNVTVEMESEGSTSSSGGAE